jgi:hypothetical protein
LENIKRVMRKTYDKHADKFEANTPLKGQCHEILPPRSPIVPVVQFRFCSKAAEIFATRNSKCTTDREFGIIYRGPGLLAVE